MVSHAQSMQVPHLHQLLQVMLEERNISSVDSEVNKLKVGRILFLSTFTPVDFNNIISRIGN